MGKRVKGWSRYKRKKAGDRMRERMKIYWSKKSKYNSMWTRISTFFGIPN